MKKSFCCIFCNGISFNIQFQYSSPPINETKFELKNQNYKRRYVSCKSCGHWFSQHKINLKHLYSGKYVNATYRGKISETFEKIISVPWKKSDNFGSSVSISGNYAIVGAYKHNNNQGKA